jgi:hypothetical protein
MSDTPRKQLRLSLAPDMAQQFSAAKAAAEKAAGIVITDAQYALNLIRRGLES